MAGVSVLVLFLAVTPPASIKLASPGISSVNVTPELQNFVTDHLNQHLVLAGVDVLSSSQVAAVVGLERQKQLLGCSSNNECIAEFANALGVDGLLLGSLAKFGATYQLDVRVAASTDARNLATVSIRVPDESGLLDAISQASTSIAKQLSETMKVSLTPVGQTSVAGVAMKTQYGTARTAGVWTFVASSAVVVAGVVLVFASPTQAPGGPPVNDTLASVGTAMMAVGAPGVVIGGLLWIFAGNEQVPIKAALFPSRDGFHFALGGSF
ncbi:MAG: hypothetical protein H6Q89_3730 [Myxococcaceae bacterium]|nr:hypothetical protein [Myxococcaceae bacterium]